MNFMRKFRLQKTSDYRELVAIPDVLRERGRVNSYKVSKVGLKKEASICLSQFIKVMRNNPRVDFSSFIDHCVPYSIVEMNKMIVGKVEWHGAFLAISNLIYVDAKKVKAHIFHELMHKLSTKYYGNYIFSGFKQVCIPSNEDGEIRMLGEGVNEGYTQLLTERYFGEFGITKTYDILVDFLSFMERIIGLDVMEEFYFGADLPALIEEITSFISLDDTIALLKDFDEICTNVYDNNRRLSILKAKKSFRRILKTIFKMAILKIENSYLEKEKTSYFLEEMATLVDDILFYKLVFEKSKIKYELSSEDLKELNDYAKSHLNKHGLSFEIDMKLYKSI